MFISTGNKKDNFKYSNPSLAVEILSDLAESIRKPMPKASNTNTEYVSENLLRVDRGKSFKGHEANIHLTNEGNNSTLSIMNKYLGGFVGYYYNVNQGVTDMSVMVNFDAPKWYMKKVYSIKKLYKLNGNIHIKLDQSKSIEVDDFGARLVDRTETIGMVMYGHRRNIHMITENRHILSKFRKWFKGVDINHLEFRETRVGDEWSATGWQIINYKI
tara:strand:- start:178 stop:825 length:648 start_codon:yes stop_codon:yes gene_type:complete